jgi:imidazolonepropionase-like amidohydrolase
MAHAHTNDAAIRCVTNGVRSIEHATMIEPSGAQAIANHGAFAVPTLAIIDAISTDGASIGLPPPMIAKMREITGYANQSLQHLREVQVKIGFGTDLLGRLMDRQSSEFRLRREVCTPLEILRSATSVNAELLQMTGNLGTLSPGAFADILVLDGDPLADITVLERYENLRLIVRGGQICRNCLN